MTKYVLDTNAVSALLRADFRVIARLERVARSDVSIPQPALAEIAYGIERLPRSKRRERLRRAYDRIRSEIAAAPWTDGVTERFAVIKADLERRGRRIEDFDAAIAAHALAAGAILVTADRHHMPRVSGLELEDWTAPT